MLPLQCYGVTICDVIAATLSPQTREHPLVLDYPVSSLGGAGVTRLPGIFFPTPPFLEFCDVICSATLILYDTTIRTRVHNGLIQFGNSQPRTASHRILPGWRLFPAYSSTILETTKGFLTCTAESKYTGPPNFTSVSDRTRKLVLSAFPKDSTPKTSAGLEPTT